MSNKRFSAASGCLIIMAATLISLLTGCKRAVNLKKDDIKNYVETELGMTDFTVSSHPESAQPDNSYLTDRLWTVTDNNSGVVFHVLDDHAGAGQYSFSTANYLSDDYGQQLIIKYADELPKLSHIEYTIRDKISEFGDSDYYAHVRKYDYLTGRIQGSYSTRTELREAFEEIEQLEAAIDDFGFAHPKKLRVDLMFKFDMRDDDDYIMADASVGLFEDDYKTLDGETNYEYAEKLFLDALLEYRYDEEALSEFTHEEIVENIAKIKSSDPIGIYRNAESERADMYDDLIEIKGGGKADVSFGSFYEILKREGFSPKGTPRHYTFTGIDGAEYEVSYDFFEMGTLYKRNRHFWHYFKNGEKKPAVEDGFYGFSVDEVRDMTGLEIAIGDYPRTISEESADSDNHNVDSII